MQYHQSVLLNESIEGLNIQPEGIYVDVTYGGGGHTKEILKRLTKGRVIAFDKDKDTDDNKINDDRLTIIPQDFRHLKEYLHHHQVLSINGLIADLGVSSHQFDSTERGFSTRFEDTILDMRMDQAQTITARDILNEYTEQELTNVFRSYGELKNAYKLAKKICSIRKDNPINTVKQLKETLAPFADRKKENQYYARVFQSLRIEVNDEMTALKELLEQSKEMLTTGGRLVVISYHSLEDRIAKHFMKKGKLEGELEKDFYGNSLSPFKIISRNVIVPTEKEIEQNARARSAKLRIAEKI